MILTEEQFMKEAMQWMLSMPEEGSNLVRKQRVKARMDLNDAFEQFIETHGS